jgi:hypothetical protein
MKTTRHHVANKPHFAVVDITAGSDARRTELLAGILAKLAADDLRADEGAGLVDDDDVVYFEYEDSAVVSDDDGDVEGAHVIGAGPNG